MIGRNSWKIKGYAGFVLRLREAQAVLGSNHVEGNIVRSGPDAVNGAQFEAYADR